MLVIAGLGLDPKTELKRNTQIADLIKSSDCCYMDSYTNTLENDAVEAYKAWGVRMADRELLESGALAKEAREKKVALLVPGDPLFATTHHSLVIECAEKGIECKVINNVSIHTAAISLSGLQGYRFGRTVTLTTQNGKHVLSPYELIGKNLNNGMHTLALVDPAMDYGQVQEGLGIASEIVPALQEKMVVMQKIGMQGQMIRYCAPGELRGIAHPFCFVVPAELHFMEKEFLEKVHGK